MQAALRARLLAAGAVSAIIGTRVYWVDRPQASALPAITLQTITDIRPQHLKGFEALRETRVQMDVWAASYSQARTLVEAAIAAVVPENTANGIIFNRAMIDSSRDLGERVETQFIHRIQTDLLVWWQAA